ncbi:MAG: H4MPT-linked C1 transfer pathway protein [Planctomycetaceae bacterium]|nr:H4MPT-linked C1 transfer pathway protein [Planctomycetaceae bacterium]
MHVIGLDIGGANLKGASTQGIGRSAPFEIWRAPGDLRARLHDLLGAFPKADLIALTMTAELADCFETKAEGVEFVLQAARQASAGIPLIVWLTTGSFAPADVAVNCPMQVASANWHALAAWAGRLVPESTSLVVDVGSTTTDVIPIRRGVPCPTGFTDVARLLSGELVYTGARRTPVCAVAAEVPLRGGFCPLAAEWFATMLDVNLVLGSMPEDLTDRATANGGPATVAGAVDRLCRAVCCDRFELSLDEVRTIAEFLADRQIRQIAAAIERVAVAQRDVVSAAVVTGTGEFLARRALQCCRSTRGLPVISLGERMSPAVTEAACAYAVAVLASESATLS